MIWIKDLPYRFKIFISFITVALIPLVLCSFVLVEVYTVTSKYQTQKDSSQQVIDLSNRLSNLFESQIEASKLLVDNNLAANVLIDTKMVEYSKELYQTLYNIQSSMKTQSSFTIYDIGGYQRFSTNSDEELRVYPTYWGIINKLRHNTDSVFYVTDYSFNPKSKSLIQSGRAIETSTGIRLGYIVMGVSKQTIDYLFDGLLSYRDTVIITDQHMNLIYASNSDYADHVLQSFTNNKLEPGFIYRQMEEPLSGFHIFLRKPIPLASNTLKLMYQLSAIIALISLTLCLIISLRMGNSLTKPISLLNLAMNQVKGGDLTVQIDNNRSDELGNLSKNFNHMTMELRDYLAKQIQHEKDLNDTRLRLFQTQLNPHFLYNTLDSIRWKAKIHHINEIASMSENLADILRESISGSQFTTLKKELMLVESYVQIQLIRFADRFVYEAEVPPQLEDVIVPKLLIQPIVENSIIHGLAGRKNGVINVYADQVGPNIQINVTDDGFSMSKEILDWLNSDRIVKKEGHLGLFNLDNIIKMYFGKEYGLSAIVEEGIGTTITVTLPIKKEGEHD